MSSFVAMLYRIGLASAFFEYSYPISSIRRKPTEQIYPRNDIIFQLLPSSASETGMISDGRTDGRTDTRTNSWETIIVSH